MDSNTTRRIVMNTLHRAGVCLEIPSVQFVDGKIACLNAASKTYPQFEASVIRWTTPTELLESGTLLSHLYGQCQLDFTLHGDELIATGGEGTQGDCGFVRLERRLPNASPEFLWMIYLPGANPIKSISVANGNLLIATSTSDLQFEIPCFDPLAFRQIPQA